MQTRVKFNATYPRSTKPSLGMPNHAKPHIHVFYPGEILTSNSDGSNTFLSTTVFSDWNLSSGSLSGLQSNNLQCKPENVSTRCLFSGEDMH